MMTPRTQSLIPGLREALKVYDFAMDVMFNSVEPLVPALLRTDIKQWALDNGFLGPDLKFSEKFLESRSAVYRVLADLEAREPTEKKGA